MSFWAEAPPPPEHPKIGALGWLRVGLRGPALGFVVLSALGLILLVRLIERPLCGLRRPVSPRITRFASRAALLAIGLRYRTVGRAMARNGAIVANHASWLDILVLNASALVYFVAKSEVSRWPTIGLLSRSIGTLFINRDGREAREQKALFEARLGAGHRLLFFPEGTSTDGLRVLPFKPTLFAAFFVSPLKESCAIQPATIRYTAPPGQDPRFYGWWAAMDFAQHLVKLLAAPRHGSVEVTFHEPLPVENYADRKELARAAEESVRAAMPSEYRAEIKGP